MRGRRLGTLRQDDADAIAPFHAQRGERIGEAVRLLLQIPIRMGRGGAVFVFPVERYAGGVVRVPVAADIRDVEALGDFPLEAVVDLAIAVAHRSSVRRRTYTKPG